MLVAVLADAHAHADALDAVIAAADEHGVDELWSLGDMVGRGPDPEHVVARTRERCRIALLGNHDYVVTGSAEAKRFVRSFDLARERLDEDAIAWMRSRKPAASVRAANRAVAVQLWHGGPRNAVHQFVGPSNAADSLSEQRAPLGLVGHTHVPAAFHDSGRRVRIRPGEPLDLSSGRWLLNPGAVGAPESSTAGWWPGLDAQAAALWLLLDRDRQTATWMRAPFDPAPAHGRVRLLGLEDG